MAADLALYETARTALAEAVRIDEVKEILDKSAAIGAYARQAKDRQLEANAVELRERATRRLGQLLADEKQSGRISPGQPPKKNGREAVPFFSRTTLAEIGVDKRLSQVAQRVAAVPEAEFEGRLEHMRAKVAEGRSPTDALRDREREVRREVARGLAASLSERSAALPSGRRFAVLYADPPWRRKAGFGDRAYENHFPTMTWDDIIGMPVKDRLLPDAWGFLWMPRAHALALHPVEIDTPLGRTTVRMPLAWAVAQAWGFDDYSTCCVWTKTDEEHPDEAGSGLIFRDQDELLFLFRRGRALPMPAAAEKFGSNHRERSRPLGHSRKPEFYRDMIRTMVGPRVPVLELFARVDADNPMPKGFFGWGNQAEPVDRGAQRATRGRTAASRRPPAAKPKPALKRAGRGRGGRG